MHRGYHPSQSQRRSESSGLNSDEISELREAFNLFDTDSSGTIDPAELRAAMLSLQYETKNPSIYQIISEIEAGTSGQKINFDAFLDGITSKLGDRDSRDGIQKIFNMFDVDKRGTLTLSSLQRISKELGENMSDSELKEMIDRADSTGTGEISFDDFYNIMTRKVF